MLKVGKRFSVILGVLALSLSTGTVVAASYDPASEGVVKILKHFEHFRPEVYNAGDKRRTIGYGHVIDNPGKETFISSEGKKEILGKRPIT